jgi:hypothetical protein
MSHQAITTKYLGATNSRGSRIKVTCEATTVTVPWNNALGVEENHDAAARALIKKLEWYGNWARGSLSDCVVYVCLMRAHGTMIADLRTPHPQTVSPLFLLSVKP